MAPAEVAAAAPSGVESKGVPRSKTVEGVSGLEGLTIDQVQDLWATLEKEKEGEKVAPRGQQQPMATRQSPDSVRATKGSPDSKPEKGMVADLDSVEAEVSGKKGDVAELESEIDERKGELAKLKAELAAMASEKLQLDGKVLRAKQRLADWAQSVEEASKKVPSPQAGESPAVLNARLLAATEELSVLRKRESAMTSDIEYLEARLASEKRDALELQRWVGEARTARREAERELLRLRPEASFLRKTAVALQRRVAAEEEELVLLRQQLSKSQAAEMSLMSQVESVSKEAAALRQAAAKGKEGEERSDAQKQLSEQLQRNSELEAKCLQLGKSMAALELRMGEEERKRVEVQRSLAQVEESRAALERERSLAEAAQKSAREDQALLAKEAAAAQASAAAIPGRVWGLLEQMASEGELARLQWLGKSVAEELQRVRQGGAGAKAAPLAPAIAVPSKWGAQESKSTGVSPGAAPQPQFPGQIRNSLKAIGRTLSKSIKLSESATPTPSEPPSTPRGEAPSEGSGPDSVPALKKVTRWLSRSATGDKGSAAA